MAVTAAVATSWAFLPVDWAKGKIENSVKERDGRYVQYEDGSWLKPETFAESGSFDTFMFILENCATYKIAGESELSWHTYASH